MMGEKRKNIQNKEKTHGKMIDLSSYKYSP